MKNTVSVVNKTEYKVTFTAVEVTRILHDIMKAQHTDIPAKPSVWGFERSYLPFAMQRKRREFQDIVFSWTVKNE